MRSCPGEIGKIKTKKDYGARTVQHTIPSLQLQRPAHSERGKKNIA